MNEKIEVKQVLRVFQKIIKHGNQYEQQYSLNGINADSGFDGYTITLSNQYVSLDILFHNKFNFTYTNRKERDVFLEKLTAIDKNY